MFSSWRAGDLHAWSVTARKTNTKSLKRRFAIHVVGAQAGPGSLFGTEAHGEVWTVGACAGCGGGAGAVGAGRLGCAAARLLRAQARGSVAGSPSARCSAEAATSSSLSRLVWAALMMGTGSSPTLERSEEHTSEL